MGNLYQKYVADSARAKYPCATVHWHREDRHVTRIVNLARFVPVKFTVNGPKMVGNFTNLPFVKLVTSLASKRNLRFGRIGPQREGGFREDKRIRKCLGI